MTVEGHIQSLQRRHAQIDREINTMISNRADSLEIAAAKKRKLQLKDQMVRALVQDKEAVH